MDDRQALRLHSLGEKTPQLVFRNGLVFNVFTGELLPGDIAVQNGVIVGVGSYRGEREVDLGERVVIPGLIDAHMHLESTMVSPRLFAEKILPWGTTTLIADPHEIANVLGAKGISYLLEETKGLPLNVYLMLPSCVPATRFEHNGAPLSAQEMAQFLHHPRVLGLGEVMDCPAVLAGDPDKLEKLRLFAGKPIDGHAPGLTGKELAAYRLLGVSSDHECTTFQEALEKLRCGMTIQVREGSAARNLDAILTGAVKMGLPLDRFVFCTDDKHLDDIAREGHIRWNVLRAIQLGVPPGEAVKMATLYPAHLYGLSDLGAIAPGFRADLVVLDSLEEMAVHSVYKDGVLVSRKGSSPTLPPNPRPIDPAGLDTVHLGRLTPESLALPVQGEIPVITLLPGSIVTKKEISAVPTAGGCFQPQGEFYKIAVAERHHATGNIGVGVVKGFGVKNGAIASTIAHDAHNMIVVGDNDRDMLLAMEELARCHGGYTVVENGRVAGTLPLPIAGLFTDDRTADIQGKLGELIAKVRAMGVRPEVEPFITLSFVSLTCIPEIRITDLGVFDFATQSFLLP